MTTKAVILARGLGTRMRKADESAALDEQTAKIAASGVKAMIPTLGRPFLDFVLSTLADSGYTDACLVIGPEHDQVREYYERTLKLSRIRVSFAVQDKPLGTGDAVRPAEAFAAGDSFLMINSDNFYPPECLAALAKSPAPAVAVFGKQAMLTGSNIPADRIGKFSVVETNADGTMKHIIEKPDDATLARLGDSANVSMNCWLFDSRIFDACRAIKPSPRGEYEITDAVQHCIDAFGQSFKVHAFASPVLDLSSRGDIAAVNEKLTGVDVRL
ncbi:MAG TPA: sugar phosphate nucleotidyltransferase [Tepidisphaeraceae bacterium]|jgi:glucose-1-phosphate thymidylyltransferase